TNLGLQTGPPRTDSEILDENTPPFGSFHCCCLSALLSLPSTEKNEQCFPALSSNEELKYEGFSSHFPD
ncbi:hypothetical protein PJI17_33020, partial [Mycobacterium kansasii]